MRKRLILIDALYSTNMNRRLYGIDQLAMDLSRYSDQGNIRRFKLVLKGNDEKWVYGLFKKKYGMKKKNADPSARCFSLITKYAYFLCNFDFPISDSLVRSHFNKLLKEIEKPPVLQNRLPPSQDVPAKKFMNCLCHLRKISGLSFEEIDCI